MRSSIGGSQQYLSRGQIASIICRVSRNSWRTANVVCCRRIRVSGRLPQGNLDIEVDRSAQWRQSSRKSLSMSFVLLSAVFKRTSGHPPHLVWRGCWLARTQRSGPVSQGGKYSRYGAFETPTHGPSIRSKGLGALSPRGNTASLWAEFQSSQLEFWFYRKPTTTSSFS